MADDIAVAAVAQRSITPSSNPVIATQVGTAADRLERGVELFSRWAGILAFFGTIAALAWLIF